MKSFTLLYHDNAVTAIADGTSCVVSADDFLWEHFEQADSAERKREL